jgi:hypothetical protein
VSITTLLTFLIEFLDYIMYNDEMNSIQHAECRRLSDFNNYFVGGWGDVERLISKTVQLSSCVVGRSVVQLVPIVQSFSPVG